MQQHVSVEFYSQILNCEFQWYVQPCIRLSSVMQFSKCYSTTQWNVLWLYMLITSRRDPYLVAGPHLQKRGGASAHPLCGVLALIPLSVMCYAMVITICGRYGMIYIVLSWVVSLFGWVPVDHGNNMIKYNTGLYHNKYIRKYSVSQLWTEQWVYFVLSLARILGLN